MLICLNINSKSTSFSVSKSKLFVLVSVCAGVFGALIGCVSKLHCQAKKKMDLNKQMLKNSFTTSGFAVYSWVFSKKKNYWSNQ